MIKNMSEKTTQLQNEVESLEVFKMSFRLFKTNISSFIS